MSLLTLLNLLGRQGQKKKVVQSATSYSWFLLACTQDGSKNPQRIRQISKFLHHVEVVILSMV